MFGQVCTIEQLVNSKIIRQGTYLEYLPDVSEYCTDPNNTGYKSQSLINDREMNWKVAFIDESLKQIFIIPENNMHESVRLQGIVGYIKGIEELHAICLKHASNKVLGTEGRSLTIEDINKICGYVPNGAVERYAYYPFYPYGYCLKGLEEFNNNFYRQTMHGCQFESFYTCDGGGVEAVDKNGLNYRYLAAGKPVFVTSTYYSYEMKNNIFGDNYFWLASQCVDASFQNVVCGIRVVAWENCVEYVELWNSDGGSFKESLGVRPIVPINFSLEIDMSNESFNGSTPKKALRFKKIKRAE